MKRTLSIITCLLLFSCTATYHTTVVAPNNPPAMQVSPPQPPPAQSIAGEQEETSYQVFYDELGSYGNWIDYPGEGYVWSPNVDQTFQPYATNGHWVYTEQGWTWASDYPWGWAAFHYGRWFYEDGYGWLWMPGHEWAPAWVTWGQSGNYYGWAPLGPHIDATQQWTPPQRSWTFVPAEHMSKPNVSQYAVDRSNNVTIVKNVTIINNNTTVINKNTVNNTVINNNTTNNVVKENVTTNNNVTNNNVTNNNTTNNNIRNNTTNNVVNNHVTNNTTIINKGPHFEEVQKSTPAPIQKAMIVENTKPAQTKTVNNTLVIYKPAIKENATLKNGAKPAPQKVQPYKNAPKKENEPK